MWFISELHEMIRVSDLVGCPMVFILLCHLGRVGGQRKLMKKFFFFIEILIRIEECSNFWKTITFRYANSLGRFPQVFRQVKKWLILGLHEMIRVLHLNVYLVTVFLFCFTILVGRVKRSNLWKMLHFKQFLAFGFFSSSSWAG